MDQGYIIPVLSPSDIQNVAYLIQGAYLPGQNLEQARHMQQQLFEMQKHPEAWGLVLPLLEFSDPNVQFFGAHTAQVKIARDWESFPQEHALQLSYILIGAAGRVITLGKNRVTLKKLYVAICSLALKLVPGQPSQWPDWILSVVTSLSGSGARPEHILDFLGIAAEEIATSDLTPTNKAQMQQSLTDAIPVVTETVRTVLMQRDSCDISRNSAFKCLEAWIAHLTGHELTSLIPILIQLLSNEPTFIGASDVLQEILSSSPLAGGSGTKTLTEPIFSFLESSGTMIVQQTLSRGEVNDVSHSLCKLLVALGEHSIDYIAGRLSAPHVQMFVRLLFSYTALPGYYGVDEEESEMTLSFWYLLQEALWNLDSVESEAETALEEWGGSVRGNSTSAMQEQHHAQNCAATPIYAELVQVLKRKATWPGKVELATWTKDQVEKFQVYRRDVGDTLINAYYILRSTMLKLYIDEVVTLLNTMPHNGGSETVEAILHCIMSVQEAVELVPNEQLERLFGSEVIGRLPTVGNDRERRTTLGLIGTYATWFTIPIDDRYLLGSLNYVVQALDEPSLSLPAANALRELCDANRTKLAPHIAEFGQLHARLSSIPDSEKAKIIQSIASVIQALPPDMEIEPVDAIVSPVVAKLSEALESATRLPEEVHAIVILQLQTLTGCAKGLTRTTDVLFAYEPDARMKSEMDKMQRARDDLRMQRLRDTITRSIQGVISLWSDDATTADMLNGLIVSITALPTDLTLLSLPASPLLLLICSALQRHPNAVWLSLATMLVHQLDPPSYSTLVAEPTDSAKRTVLEALPLILETCLRFFQAGDAMQANPDVVQAFFGCMETVAQHFAALFFQLPDGALDALMRCAISALSLQERYSLVSACKFMVYLINRTIPIGDLEKQGRALVHVHGRAILRVVLCGIAGASPTSTAQNLVDLLMALVTRCLDECRVWIPEILFSNEEFIPTKAGQADKEKFAKAVLSYRTTRKAREAAQHFAIIAKGLEGSSFGYASVTM